MLMPLGRLWGFRLDAHACTHTQTHTHSHVCVEQLKPLYVLLLLLLSLCSLMDLSLPLPFVALFANFFCCWSYRAPVTSRGADSLSLSHESP